MWIPRVRRMCAAATVVVMIGLANMEGYADMAKWANVVRASQPTSGHDDEWHLLIESLIEWRALLSQLKSLGLM
jgi:hypothetical protein